MATFKHMDKDIYYEVHGDSETTLVVLNGIMMSTASWQAFIPHLKKHYKVVLVDFHDQGKSEFMDEGYSNDIQVDVVLELMKLLDLKEVVLMGISYGGEIAMRLAIKDASRLKQLILSNTTAYTNQQLKAIGENWIYAAQTHDGAQFFKATIPPIYSMGFYENHIEWLTNREKLFISAFSHEWYDGFIRLVNSAENHDVRDQIHQIEVPTLVISADEDIITPLPCQYELMAALKNAHHVELKNCGHASMYEQPTAFMTAVNGFIKTNNDDFNIL